MPLATIFHIATDVIQSTLIKKLQIIFRAAWIVRERKFNEVSRLFIFYVFFTTSHLSISYDDDDDDLLISFIDFASLIKGNLSGVKMFPLHILRVNEMRIFFLNYKKKTSRKMHNWRLVKIFCKNSLKSPTTKI